MNDIIAVDELTALRESYDELKTKNKDLSDQIYKDAYIIDCIRDELNGKEKLLRMMTSAALREEKRRKKVETDCKMKLEKMGDEMKIKMVGIGFVTFGAALATFTIIYLVVKFMWAGWI